MKGLRVDLTIEERGCDDKELSDVAYFLQQELQELDCVAAITHAHLRPEYVAIPKEPENLPITLIIMLNETTDPSTFIAALADWLDRRPFRSLKLEVGGFETSATSLNPNQKNALTNWFRRQLFEEPMK
jgi:hypothetical protein